MHKAVKYYSDINIKILDDELGKNGKNMTIVILTYNKSILTIRLLDSIIKYFKGFQGDILLFDNNSNKEEKIKLKSYLQNYPMKYKLYCSKENLGISNGRKRAFSMVNNKWILSLDNDMYFIGNPMKDLNYCINTTGARFINLSAYDGRMLKKTINGGRFKITKADITYVTADTFKSNMKDRVFLSNFVFGGSSLINKYSYDMIGGYDKNFFVGYEDVDLSIRIYKTGIKIANISSVYLVHDHVMLSDIFSNNYEKVRYNDKNIMNSVNYFIKKYNNKYSVLSKGEKEFLDKITKKIKN